MSTPSPLPLQHHIFKVLDSGAAGGQVQKDADSVNLIIGLGGRAPGHVHFGGGQQTLFFEAMDRFLGLAVIGDQPGLDFHKTQGIPFLGNDVNFSPAGAEVAFHNLKALALQKSRREIFAEFSPVLVVCIHSIKGTG